MIHLSIPGYSVKNKQEQSLNSSFLLKKGIKTINYNWNHWNTNTNNVGVDYYIDDLIKHIADNNYGIISKSIGTYFAAKLINKMLWEPKYVILMGIPLESLEDIHKEEFKILSKINCPVHIIHNTNDPQGSWDKIQNFLQDFKFSAKIFNKDHHEYVYPEEIYNIVNNLKYD